MTRRQILVLAVASIIHLGLWNQAGMSQFSAGYVPSDPKLWLLVEDPHSDLPHQEKPEDTLGKVWCGEKAPYWKEATQPKVLNRAQRDQAEQAFLMAQLTDRLGAKAVASFYYREAQPSLAGTPDGEAAQQRVQYLEAQLAWEQQQEEANPHKNLDTSGGIDVRYSKAKNSPEAIALQDELDRVSPIRHILRRYAGVELQLLPPAVLPAEVDFGSLYLEF
jgi:hypothetical protein